MTKKRTEGEMLGLLRQRYTEKAGNGDAWAFVEKVRDAAGFDAKRTVDAMAMSLWPSRGLRLHGFEVKCSRNDWLRELKDPSKSESFMRHLDYWWLVAADASIVAAGELPETWGLLVATGNRLVCKVEAPKLDPQPLPRGMLASLLRSACRVAQATPTEVRHAAEEARAASERGWSSRVEHAERDIAKLREQIATFERESGVSLATWKGRTDRASEVGRAVKAALEGGQDIAHLLGRIERIGQDAQVLAEQAARIRAKHEPTPQGRLDVAA
jgi:hypothetical protein